MEDEEELNFVDGLDIDAILGWHALNGLAVTFDGRAQTLTFGAPSGEPDENTLLWWTQPRVRGTLGGRSVVLAVDTGASDSYLTKYGARRLGLPTVKAPKEGSGGVRGAAISKRALANPVVVRIGGADVPSD